VDLEAFMRLGFALFVAAQANAGAIDHAVLRAENVASIFTPLSPDEGVRVVDRWYAASPAELRVAGREQEISGLEKWSFNPLTEHPVVSVGGRYVMPWPRLVLDRCTPTGLYFIGLSAFGPQFPDRLGCMFERYVGEQLRLLQYAQVVPEIVYGKPEKRTVDYFLITDEAVVLVEAKAARPTWHARLGDPDGDSDIVSKLTKAFNQVERSAGLIKEDHPAARQIPKARPVLGLVITLEPFHLANSLLYRDLLPNTSVPTVVVSSHELEGFLAATAGLADVGARPAEALVPSDGKDPSLARAAVGMDHPPNQLLDAAWERFTAPWAGIAANLGASWGSGDHG
jgi:hypothetical protein